MRGVTIDQVTEWDEVIRLADLLSDRTGRKWWMRIVFDPSSDTDARYYCPYLERLAPHALVLGEILDSYDLHLLSVPEYKARCCQFRDTLGPLVGCWEIGNEVNGQWTGKDVHRKVLDAFAVFEGAPRLLTLYLDQQNEEPSPWEWAKKVPESVRTTIEWLGLSYYGDELDETAALGAFRTARSFFPNARLLLSECGFADEVEAAAKQRRFHHYYRVLMPRLEARVLGFIGGGFWWRGWQDRESILAWL